jgi:hypothetical protein
MRKYPSDLPFANIKFIEFSRASPHSVCAHIVAAQTVTGAIRPEGYDIVLAVSVVDIFAEPARPTIVRRSGGRNRPVAHQMALHN